MVVMMKTLQAGTSEVVTIPADLAATLPAWLKEDKRLVITERQSDSHVHHWRVETRKIDGKTLTVRVCACEATQVIGWVTKTPNADNKSFVKQPKIRIVVCDSCGFKFPISQMANVADPVPNHLGVFDCGLR